MCIVCGDESYTPLVVFVPFGTFLNFLHFHKLCGLRLWLIFIAFWCLNALKRWNFTRFLFCRGKNVLNQKSELAKAMEKHKDSIMRKEYEHKLASQTPELVKVIQDRAKRLEEVQTPTQVNKTYFYCFIIILIVIFYCRMKMIKELTMSSCRHELNWRLHRI